MTAVSAVAMPPAHLINPTMTFAAFHAATNSSTSAASLSSLASISVIYRDWETDRKSVV